MRFFVSALTLALVVTACAPASPGPSGAAPAASSGPGVRLFLDGKPIDLGGVSNSIIERGGGFATIFIEGGKNPRGSGPGYGVRLEMQTKGDFKEGFAAKDVAAATFTVYKERDFWYISAAGLAGRPIAALKLDSTTGRIKGSYEDGISGTTGKFKGRVEFDVPFPK
ncbi:MAG: hypothetical protein HYX92_05030 [Chloroflexi bacterium]|nr:hypothetical protein [Chloroflexota bacterium]